MKSRSILMLASAGLALAHPSQDVAHNHKRWHELKARQATETTVVSTVSVYELNGQQITYEELQEGLKNGTLVLDGSAPAASPKVEKADSAPVAPVLIKASSKPKTTPSTTQQAPPPSTTASPAPASSSPAAPAVENKNVQPPSNNDQQGGRGGHGGSWGGHGGPPSSGGSGSSGYGSDTGSGLTSDYDGSLSCDTFPSAFGAIPVNYLGNGGWLAIMTPGSGSSSSSLDNLSTGNTCTEGSYCSYACPAGWEKTQWPSAQGATGQSVGGLLCEQGKLKLTRPDVPQLCSNSMTKAKISVQNKMTQQVSICRTDYPGTENMNIPLGLQGGATSDIACPDGDTAYKWQGKTTSAQYYVNPAGVGVEEACVWGSSSQPYGNWAPTNLGVGYSNGNAWLSIFPNRPTQMSATLKFKISIVGDIIGNGCTYKNGAYNGSPDTGCTVTVPTGGQATFLIEDA